MERSETITGKAWEFYEAVREMERCDRVINLYAEHGIAGTSHDLEHREMRAAALEKAKRLQKEIQL